MVESTGKVLEGVFAIRKPISLSSAQVLRDLQHSFTDSKTFAPLRAQESQNRDGHRSKRRRIDKNNVFKMGHGGTLDPMATGVLMVGIGRGTKHLQSFLNCTKVYRTVVLFGKSTDTYDVAGKVVASAESSHVTEELVKQKIKDHFSGAIKQVPPIYSALKIDGIKAYEYARSGKQLPRELYARQVNISEIRMVKWHASGDHDYRWPIESVPEEEKAMYQRLFRALGDDEDDAEKAPASPDTNPDQQAESPTIAPELAHSPPHSKSKVKRNTLSKDETAARHTHAVSKLSESAADGPAATIEMTVSSGFYVRSFAHDLGIACGTYGTMAELTRTRQGDYTTEEPAQSDSILAIDYAETQQSEEIWGPKIRSVLGSWMEKHPAPQSQGGGSGTSHNRENSHRYDSNRGFTRTGQGHRRLGGNNDDDADRCKRRNSSSPE